jgi:hypothetical protein
MLTDRKSKNRRESAPCVFFAVYAEKVLKRGAVCKKCGYKLSITHTIARAIVCGIVCLIVVRYVLKVVLNHLKAMCRSDFGASCGEKMKGMPRPKPLCFFSSMEFHARRGDAKFIGAKALHIFNLPPQN